MDRTLAVELRGRLGNNLFQWAAARHLTAPEDPVVVDDTFSSLRTLEAALLQGSVRRLTRAERVRLRRPPRLGAEGSLMELASRATLRRLERSVIGAWMVDPVRVEGDGDRRTPAVGAFDPSIGAQEEPLLLRGYFQDERYFLPSYSTITRCFRPPSIDLSAWTRPSTSRPTAALVIRSGPDYEQLELTTPIDWYLSSMRELIEVVGDVEVTVFSDVRHVAELMATHIGTFAPARAAVGLDPVDQLHGVSRLEHAVIASSSFAWWGAWLGDVAADFDPSRVVIAPAPWLDHPCSPAPGRWRQRPLHPQSPPSRSSE
jgi:hypothetical protein